MVLNVFGDLLDIGFERNDTNRVLVCFSEDRTQARNLMSDTEIELLAINGDVATNPVLTDGFDLGKFWVGNLSFM